MQSAVEIKMTAGGFEVTAGGHTLRFPKVDDALDFAQQRLRHAQHVRDLSTRCE